VACVDRRETKLIPTEQPRKLVDSQRKRPFNGRAKNKQLSVCGEVADGGYCTVCGTVPTYKVRVDESQSPWLAFFILAPSTLFGRCVAEWAPLVAPSQTLAEVIIGRFGEKEREEGE